MLVSILIPCYNAERWIGEAISSALAQTWPHKEVIVVDDGSTDQSWEVIQRFGHAIRAETGPNRGGNVARNRLLTLAHGEWLQYLDADDYLLPDKVARQTSFVETHPDADIVFGPITIEHWSEAGSRHELLPIPEPHDPWVLLARWSLPQTGSPLWRKSAVAAVGGWKDDQLTCQEHELYLRLLQAGRRFEYCPSNGAVWRVWGDRSLSHGDRAGVRRRRLVIEQGAEDFLSGRGRLTPARREAISQARFDLARVAWREGDFDGARAAHAALRHSDPGFQPAGEPLVYQLLLRSLGFETTEVVAQWRRRWLRR